MSVIDKKPFIVTLLDTLNADELKTLNNLINGNNNSVILRSLKKDTTYPLTVADKGIKEARIEIYGPSAQSIYNGYLIYTDDYCCLISYSSEKSTNLSLIEMNLTSDGWVYAFRTCGLTILELRSELNNRLIQAGAIIPENVKFTVTNIKSLTDAQCEELKAGDIIAKKTGNQYHTYVVSYNEKNHGLCLTYSDASVVETVSYDKVGGHWVYNSEDKTDFSQIGGGLPEVTALDNEKVLEVIAGVWGKGRKKVNVIDAPSSTTLTEEQVEFVKGGVFFNGTFLGYKNPILLPLGLSAGNYLTGLLLYTNDSNVYGTTHGFRRFLIHIPTRVVTLTTGGYIEFMKDTNDGTKTILRLYGPIRINDLSKPQVEVALTNLGTITSTETATGSNFYKNEIPYTGGIGNEDVINVKMSNGAVYQAINDTTNSKLVIYTAVDFATNSISVSKCWKLAY